MAAIQRPGDMPTLQEMRQWRDSLCGEWGTFDSEVGQEEDVYFQKFDIDAPGGKYGVKTGSAPADTDSTIDAITPQELIVKVKPARARKKYRDQADTLVRFGKATLKQWRKKRDPIRMLAADMTIRRLAIARVIVDKNLWPDLPDDITDKIIADAEHEFDPVTQKQVQTAPAQTERDAWEAKNRRRFPILLERRSPRYTRFRQADNGDLLAVCEHYQTTVFEGRVSLGRFPKVLEILRGRDANEKVWVDDIWVGKYRCLMLEDRPIFPFNVGTKYSGVAAPGYSRPPYLIAPFRELPFEEVHLRFRGFLSACKELYQAESQGMSMQLSMLAYNAWRTYIGWTVDGRNLDVFPGNVVEIDRQKGEFLETMEGTAIPPEVLQTVAALDAYLQKNSVAQGPSTSEGTRSGQQLWAIQAIRAMKIDSAKQNLIRLLEGALALAAELVEDYIAEPITLPVPGRDRDGNDLGDVTITPAMIDGYWDGFEVDFGKRLDPALLEQAKALSALAVNNFMPWRTAVEMSGLTDVATEWENDLYLQAANHMDFIMELAGIELVKNYYGDSSWQYQSMMQRFIQEKMQSMTGGGPSAPGGPGQPPNGTGGLEPPAARGPIGEGIGGGSAMAKISRATGKTGGPSTPGGGAAPSSGRPPGGPPGGI